MISVVDICYFWGFSWDNFDSVVIFEILSLLITRIHISLESI